MSDTATRAVTLPEFLLARAAVWGATERGQLLRTFVDKHTAAPCGRHCDGHDREEYPVWPCLSLRRKAAEFSHLPDFQEAWRPITTPEPRDIGHVEVPA